MTHCPGIGWKEKFSTQASFVAAAVLRVNGLRLGFLSPLAVLPPPPISSTLPLLNVLSSTILVSRLVRRSADGGDWTAEIVDSLDRHRSSPSTDYHKHSRRRRGVNRGWQLVIKIIFRDIQQQSISIFFATLELLASPLEPRVRPLHCGWRSESTAASIIDGIKLCILPRRC